MANQIIESFNVATTLLAQRVVSCVTSSAMTVQYPQTVTALKVGVTIDTVLDTTNAIPVAMFGIAELHFNDTVNSGELVSSDTSGRGIAYALALTSTAISNASSYLGLLVGETIGATGTISKVLVNPGMDRATA